MSERSADLEPFAVRRCGLGRFEAVVLGLIAAALVYQLMIPPMVGLADNGDFHRVTSPLGLTHTLEDDAEMYLGYVDGKYRHVHPGYWHFVTAETFFAMLAIGVSKIVSKDGLFDIVTMGVVHSIFFLAAIALILGAGRRYGSTAKYALGVALILVTTEVGYVAYFNSFYMATAALLALCLVMAFALRAMQAEGSLKWLLAYFIAGALFVTSMSQTAPLAVFLAGFGLLLSPSRLPRLNKAVAPALALALCVVAAVSYRLGSPRSYKNLILWDSVFLNIIPNSPDAKADLTALGLDKRWIRYSGRPGLIDPGELPFDAMRRDVGGPSGVLLFYATHPDRRYAQLRRCAERAFQLRVDYLGNFEKDAGLPPRAKSQAFALWSDLRLKLVPQSHRLLFIGLFFGAIFTGSLFEMVRTRRRGLHTLMPAFVALLAALALGQFLVVAFTAGVAALVKGLWLFNFLFDSLLVIAFVWIVNLATRLWRGVATRRRVTP